MIEPFLSFSQLICHVSSNRTLRFQKVGNFSHALIVTYDFMKGRSRFLTDFDQKYRC